MVHNNVLQLCSSPGYSGCACGILFNDYVIILFFAISICWSHTSFFFFLDLVCFPVFIASTEVLFPLLGNWIPLNLFHRINLLNGSALLMKLCEH